MHNAMLGDLVNSDKEENISLVTLIRDRPEDLMNETLTDETK